MKNTFIVISTVFAIASIIPYITNILKRKTKPRVVSWFTWSLLTGIASAASFSDRQYASAILTLIASLETMTVVILGLKYGDKRFTNFDLWSLAGVFTGLILWIIFNSPAIAIIAGITIDFIGTLPTFRHSWEAPHEETTITYVLGLFASIFTVFAAKEISVTAMAFPAYLVLADLTIVMILISRQRTRNLKIKHAK